MLQSATNRLYINIYIQRGKEVNGGYGDEDTSPAATDCSSGVCRRGWTFQLVGKESWQVSKYDQPSHRPQTSQTHYLSSLAIIPQDQPIMRSKMLNISLYLRSTLSQSKTNGLINSAFSNFIFLKGREAGAGGT